MGRVSLRRFLTMAAVSPEQSRDAVDIALREAVEQALHGQKARTVSENDFDPPTNQRYSIARVRDFEVSKGILSQCCYYPR